MVSSSLTAILATRVALPVNRQMEIFCLLRRFAEMPTDMAYSEILKFKEIYENSVTYEGRLLYIGNNSDAHTQQCICLKEEKKEHLLEVVAKLQAITTPLHFQDKEVSL